MTRGEYDAKYFRKYDHYLNKDLSAVPLFALILAWVKREKPKELLDVGCGLGYLVTWLCRKSKIPGAGLDSSPEALRLAQKLHPKVPFVPGSVLKLPFPDQSIQCLLMINLIEHLSEAEQKQAFKEVQRVLKKRGLLILSTPDKQSLFKILAIHDPTHKRELTRYELLELAGQAFSLEEECYTNSIGRFDKKINYFLSRLFPADMVFKFRRS